MRIGGGSRLIGKADQPRDRESVDEEIDEEIDEETNERSRSNFEGEV